MAMEILKYLSFLNLQINEFQFVSATYSRKLIKSKYHKEDICLI